MVRKKTIREHLVTPAKAGVQPSQWRRQRLLRRKSFVKRSERICRQIMTEGWLDTRLRGYDEVSGFVT